MTTQSDKLSYLLQVLWKSPVFGDSFPVSMREQKTLAQFSEIYPRFVQIMSPILQKGIPQANKDEVKEIIAQIAPKSIAFCASISAGEIQNLDDLSKAAAAIAISYWADQSMDRGDEWTLSAVQYLNHKHISSDMLNSDIFQARLEALRHIQILSHQITSSPQNLPYVLQAIERDVLGNQAQMRLLSQKYKQKLPDAFWNDYAQEVAQIMIDCSGLMSAIAIIYAIYHRHQTNLPSLEEIYAHPTLMQLVRETFNPAVRVFDDAGDYITDGGKDAAWGVFNLNIINQAHPTLVKFFIECSGIAEKHPLKTQALSNFALPIEKRRVALSRMYLDLSRQRLASLPAPLWNRYEVFLTLCKRTLEAGFVNIFGDIFLSETSRLSDFDTELFTLIAAPPSWQEVDTCA